MIGFSMCADPSVNLPPPTCVEEPEAQLRTMPKAKKRTFRCGSEILGVLTLVLLSSCANSAPSAHPTAPDICRNGQLQVTSVGGGEGAGSVYMLFEFVNVSRSACTVSGYPKVVPVDRQGVELTPGSPVTGPVTSSFYNGRAPLRIDVKPGEAASSAIQGVTHPPSGPGLSCPASYPFFLVTPPHQTRSVKVPARAPPGDRTPGAFPGCLPPDVNPIVPGTNGQPPQPSVPGASTAAHVGPTSPPDRRPSPG